MGAEAFQMDIDQVAYPKIVNMERKYKRMADLYLKAGDTVKAKEAQLKANEWRIKRK